MQTLPSFIWGCLLAFGGFFTAALADEAITVRATTLADEAIDYIATNSEPAKLKIPANELPVNMIARVCGNYTDTYGKTFFKLNPTLSPERAPVLRDVLVPACVKWKRDADGKGIPVRVASGETLDDFVRRVVGVSKDAKFVCGNPNTQQSRCDQPFIDIIRKLNPTKNLEDIKEGENIYVPLLTTPTTIILKAGISSADAVKAVSTFGKLNELNSGLLSVKEAPEIKLVGPADDDDVKYDDCDHAQLKATSAKVRWPYDGEMLAAVLKRTLKLSGGGNRIIISVIDSGIAEDFPDDFLHKNTGDPKNVYGFGTFISDQIRPFPSQPEAEKMHGTRVAHIASGGSGLKSFLSDLNSMLRISAVKVFRPVGTSYRIQSGDLGDGLAFAISNSHISNISISSSKPLEPLKQMMEKYPTKLFVIAAGNEHANLGTKATYPAGYGGDQANHIITVAAHDASLKLARFSNKSPLYADITAPGCDVPYQNDAPGVHGTSFAAPLVSLASALLMHNSLGLFSAKDIKDRLIASGDYDLSLSPDVRSSSRLNIAKALSLYDDVVELNSPSGEVLFGDWTVPTEFQLCKDPDISPPRERIRKVIPLGSDKVRFLHSDTLSIQRTDDCTVEPASFEFKTLDGSTRTLKWDDVKDLVPALWTK